jgi:hypothetical protein
MDGDNVMLETLSIGQPGYNVRNCGLKEAQEIYQRTDSVFIPLILEIEIELATEEVVLSQHIPLPQVILKGQVRLDLKESSAQIGILQSTQERVQQTRGSLLVEYSSFQKNSLRRKIGADWISYHTLVTIEDGQTLLSAENLQIPYINFGPILFMSMGEDPLYGLRGPGALQHQMLLPMRREGDQWITCNLPWKVQVRIGTEVTREFEGTLRIRVHQMRIAMLHAKFACEAKILVANQNLYVQSFNGNGRYVQLRVGFLK